MKSKTRIIIGFSLTIGTLVTLISTVGIFSSDFYSKETLNWQIQAGAQDIIDVLLIAPLLLVSSLMISFNRNTATLIWGGTLLYLIYSFAIYCFDVHFNQLFVAYCLTLGLSFYAFVYFLHQKINERPRIIVLNNLVIKTTGIYFLVLSVVFYLLWLGEVVPAIWSNTVPASLIEVGVPSNPVHVLDLSVVLPGIFITGVLLLKKKNIGFILAPVVLFFFILMDITIGVLALMMNQKGQEESVGLIIGMAMLTLLSLGLLIWYLRNLVTRPTGIDQ